MATTLSGLASGIDTSSLVNQLVTLERVPINRLQTNRSARAKQSQSVQSMTDKLRALQTRVRSLESFDQINATSATVTGAALSATSDGKAAQGSYSIAISALAKAQRTYSNGFAAKDAAGVVGAGTISVQVGAAASIDVTVTADDTLETVSQKLSVVPGMTSSVVFDGSAYHLQVSGAATGAANSISFNEQGTNLGLSLAPNQRVAAQDAQFSVDGFAITSPSNSVSTAVPGVTLQLKALTTGVPDELRVSSDSAAIKTKIKDLISAINDINKDVKAFSAGQKNADSGMQNITSQLRQITGTPVSGLDQTMAALSQLGVSTARDGSLSLNEVTLDSLLSSNAQGVIRVFASTPATTGLASKLDDALDAFVNAQSGTLVGKKASIERSLVTMDKQLDVMNKRVEDYQTRVQKQFTAMEQAVSRLNQSSSLFTTKA